MFSQLIVFHFDKVQLYDFYLSLTLYARFAHGDNS